MRPRIVPQETYSLAETAAYLLETAVDQADYRRATHAVRQIGLDPDTVPHSKPDGARVADSTRR